MKRRASITPAAERDIVAAADWYASQRPALGAEFRQQIYRTIDLIAENPHLYRSVAGAVRQARTQRFPYLLFYRVAEKQVFVIGCFHANRNPRTSSRRF